MERAPTECGIVFILCWCVGVAVFLVSTVVVTARAAFATFSYG
jgi:hypothetical protein